MKNGFFLCGTLGWCLEIIWTSLNGIKNHDYKLTGRSSLWMFPIYGLAACIRPMSNHLKKKHRCMITRGILYTCGIFATEYTTGYLLKKHDMCPWDYSEEPTNIDGLIRLDYAPVWFATGLLYENILNKFKK